MMKSKEKVWRGRRLRFIIEKSEGRLWIHYKGETWSWGPAKKKSAMEGPPGGPSCGAREGGASKGLLAAPASGSVQRLFAKKGRHAEKGSSLAVISS